MTETGRYQNDAAEVTTAALTEQAQGSARYSFDSSDLFEMEELKNRRLYINGEIDDTILDGIAFHIMRYNRDDEGIPVEDRRPIVLFMNTTGGGTTAGYGLIDVIETSETPIHTVNMAECASMGFLIYIAGDVRFSMPHAQFLMHDGACAAWDSTAKVKDRVEFEMEQVEAMTKAHVLNHTKITPKLYDEKYRVEWYFLPEKGKEIGVVDAIVGLDCAVSDIGGQASSTPLQRRGPARGPKVALLSDRSGPLFIKISVDGDLSNLSGAVRAAALKYPLRYALLEESGAPGLVARPELKERVRLVDLDNVRKGRPVLDSIEEVFDLPEDEEYFKNYVETIKEDVLERE